MRAVLALLLVLAACTAETSKECRHVCVRQNECENVQAAAAAGTASDTAFDEGECVAACAALERDPSTLTLVTSHVACVDKAGSGNDTTTCTAVLDCP